MKSKWVGISMLFIVTGLSGFWAGYNMGASKERNRAELSLVTLEDIIVSEAKKDPNHKGLSWLVRCVAASIDQGRYQRENIKTINPEEIEITLPTVDEWKKFNH